LVLQGDGSIVKGIQIVGFDGNGIEIHGDGNVVEGCIIGTDSSGNLDRGNTNAGILVDGSNNRIGVVDPLPGSLLTEWGSPGIGNGQLGAFTRDIEFDPVSGDLFVADSSNHRIQRFDTNGNFVLMWGRNGGDGTAGSGEGEFDEPFGITFDSAGNAYVTDGSNHRVQKFGPDGTFLMQWGSGPGVAPGELNNPWGIARNLDGSSEVIYVVDRENHRVQEFSTLGGFRRTWGRLGSGAGEFNRPRGIGVDGEGALYVADHDNARIQKFVPGNPCPGGTTQVTPGMCFERQWGLLGVAPRQFELPNEIDVDSAGLVYVSDLRNNRYQVFDALGNLVAVRGLAGTGSGELLQTSGIALDANDDVYAVSTVVPAIKKFRALFADPTGLPNVIAFNRGMGVAIVSGDGNSVVGNRIYGSPQSLDSGPAGPNPEDPGVPVLDAAGSINDYDATKVTGTLNSTPDTDFRLDFFFSSTCTPAGGEGRVFIGSAEARTDADGATSFAAILPFETGEPGFVSAAATSPSGNTTEFSECLPHTNSSRLVATDFLFPSLPPAIAGQPYEFNLSAAGGVAPYSWRPFTEEDAQRLSDSGLALDPSGLLHGSPTIDFGGIFTFVEDSSGPNQGDIQEIVFTVADPITITTTSLPLAVVGQPYSQFVSATGGSGRYFWDVVDDTSLPDGLVLDSVTGEIHGIATTPTDAGFTIGAFETVPGFPEQFGSRAFSFLVEFIGPPERLGFTSQPTSVGVGQNFSVTVQVQDAFGTLIDNASHLITIRIGAGPGSLSGVTARPAVEGSVVFTGLSIDTAASDYTLIASSGDLTPATSLPFDVNAVQPNLITFVVQPSNAIVGDRFSPVVQVALRNGADTVTTATNPVTLSLLTNPGGGALAGATTVEAVAGIATFTNLRINQLNGPGVGYRLRASVPGLEPTASVLFNIDAAQRVKRLNLAPDPTGNLEGSFDPILDSNAGRLYLRGELSDAIGVYDPSENDLQAHIPVSGNIRGMALDDQRDRVWVAVQLPNQVRALDTESLTFDDGRQLSLDFRPVYVAVDDDGGDRMFVAGTTGGQGVVAIFDASTIPPTQVGADIALHGNVLGAADGFALDKSNDTFYVGHSEGVSIVRGGGSFAHMDMAPAFHLAVNPSNRKLYAVTDPATIVVIDDSGATPSATPLTDPNIIEPVGVDVNSVTGRAYVALAGTNAVLSIDGADDSFSFITASTMQVPTRVSIDEVRNLVWVTNAETSFFPSVATRIDAANGNAVTEVSLPVGTNDIIVDEEQNILYFPKGNLGYIAYASGEEPSNPVEKFAATSFRGLDLSPDGRLFLANIGPREIRAVEKDSLVPLEVISRFSREVAVNGVTGKLYATSLPPGKGTDDTAELLEFDLSTLGQTGSFPTPGFQANLIVDEVSNLVYSLGGRLVPGDDFNQLLLIDPASGRIDDIDPGLPPQRGVFHRQTSKFYTPMVESNGNRTLGVVRGRTPALVPIALGGSFAIADLDIAENVDRVYAGSGEQIFVIDTTSDVLIDTITLSLGAGAEAIGVNQATQHLFVATSLGIEVYDVDGDVNEIITTLPMGVTPFYDDVAVDPQNGLVAFSNIGDRTIVLIRDDIDLTVETFPGIRRARSAPRHGLHFDPATARLYLLDTLGGSVVSIGPLR
jgi:sugar lactone lactonase YvrE